MHQCIFGLVTQKRNYIVIQYPFDVWIHSDSGMVDAKSILDLFTLSLNESIHIFLHDEIIYKTNKAPLVVSNYRSFICFYKAI